MTDESGKHNPVKITKRDAGFFALVYAELQDEVQQELGKALNYPWFKDDPKNFPGADEDDGVCVGDHVAETIVVEAATRIRALTAENERLRAALCGLVACPHIADRDPHPWHEPETEVAVSIACDALKQEEET